MKRTVILSLASLLVLTACGSPEERARKLAEREIAACKAKGLEEGTEAFDACRMTERLAAQKRRDARVETNDNFRPGTMPIQMYR